KATSSQIPHGDSLDTNSEIANDSMQPERGSLMKPSTKRYASTGILVATMAVFSTGCTVEDVLNLAKIISIFI
ncbi:MAG: hypothetical protein WBF71_12265, partial [Microthrixaceae bacterium]